MTSWKKASERRRRGSFGPSRRGHGTHEEGSAIPLPLRHRRASDLLGPFLSLGYEGRQLGSRSFPVVSNVLAQGGNYSGTDDPFPESHFQSVPHLAHLVAGSLRCFLSLFKQLDFARCTLA